MLRRITTGAAIALGKPYIKRELPGWGRLYAFLVGDYRRDWLWRGQPERWVRGKLHGYEMSVRIGGWSNRQAYFLERFYDLPTQLAMKEHIRPGDCVIDIGANEGMMSLLAARLVGDVGKVIAFEPSPVPRMIFERNVERNAIANIEIRAQGVADRPGELDLYVPEVNTGQGSFAPLPYDEGQKVVCPVVVGDEALRGEKPSFIKIDVEGFEGRVIDGLVETLSTHRPTVCIEMVTSLLRNDDRTPEAIAETMRGLGYEGRRISVARNHLRFEPIAKPWRDGDYMWTSSEPI